MTSRFTVRKHTEGLGGVRIAVTGEIDEDASAALRLIIVNAITQNGVGAVTVDLRRVPFLAAAGVRSLLNGRQAALEQGCTYRIVNAHGIVLDVLEAVGLDCLFPSADLEERV